MARGAQRIIIVQHDKKPTQVFYAGNNDQNGQHFFFEKRNKFPESKGYRVRLFKEVRVNTNPIFTERGKVN